MHRSEDSVGGLENLVATVLFHVSPKENNHERHGYTRISL